MGSTKSPENCKWNKWTYWLPTTLHIHSHTNDHTIRSNLGFSTLPKDSLIRWLQGLGIEPPIKCVMIGDQTTDPWLVDNRSPSWTTLLPQLDKFTITTSQEISIQTHFCVVVERVILPGAISTTIGWNMDVEVLKHVRLLLEPLGLRSEEKDWRNEWWYISADSSF